MDIPKIILRVDVPLFSTKRQEILKSLYHYFLFGETTFEHLYEFKHRNTGDDGEVPEISWQCQESIIRRESLVGVDLAYIHSAERWRVMLSIEGKRDEYFTFFERKEHALELVDIFRQYMNNTLVLSQPNIQL